MKYLIENIVLIFIFSLSIIIFLFIIYRAYDICFTHDESLSYTILRGDNRWLITANNHWLNTILSFITSKLFGYSEIILRLSNVLSFIPFSYFCYRLVSQKIDYSIITIICFSFILLNQFLLDFFSLFRGYGLAMSFFTGCIFFFLQLINQYNKKQLFLALLFSILTIYANYSFLYPIISLQIMFLYYHFRRSINRSFHLKEIIILFSCQILLLAPALFNVLQLKQKNELYFGSDDGFFQGTFQSVLQYTYPVSLTHYGLDIIKIAFIFIFISYFIFIFRYPTLRPIFYIISMTIIIPVILYVTLGIKYSIERSAIYWTILIGIGFSKLLNVCLKNIKMRFISPLIICIGLLIFLSVYSFIRVANTEYTTVWKCDADTYKMLKDLDKIAPKNKTYYLGINWLFEPTINYYREVKQFSWLHPVTREGILNKEYDYYYIFSTDKQYLKRNYKKIKEYPLSSTYLLKRK